MKYMKTKPTYIHVQQIVFIYDCLLQLSFLCNAKSFKAPLALPSRALNHDKIRLGRKLSFEKSIGVKTVFLTNSICIYVNQQY